MTNANDSAFTNGNTNDYNGLTKREYFAAMTMQGFLANEKAVPNRDHIEYLSRCATLASDELIKALNQQNTSTDAGHTTTKQR